MDAIRNSAKAVIIADGKLLTIQCLSWKHETYFILPGGGQNPGETLHDALRRECREELGTEIEIGPLRRVREYIGKNHEFAEKHTGIHAVEFMFLCSLKTELKNIAAKIGTSPDDAQTGIAWLPLSELQNVLFFPRALAAVLQNPEQTTMFYLGDMN